MKSAMLAALSAVALGLAACSPTPAAPAAEAPASAPAAIPFGDNAAASATFTSGGVTFYYETYGEGEPLVLIHGNGGSIASMSAQIEHFKSKYRIIAMDSRGQGKSGDGDAPLTYEQMADDIAALLDHLKVGPANVVGWSDGGIEAILLGMRHPTKVNKLVSMAANLSPGPDALFPELIAMTGEAMKAPVTTPEEQKARKLLVLIREQPNIDLKTLSAVTAPVLVMSGDHDLIRLEHTVAIFNALPNGELAIVPSSTHMLPMADAATFNAAVERFLTTPFVKKNRMDIFSADDAR